MSALNNRSHGRVNVGGCLLQYEVAGEGQPLVLIHAGIANMSMWDEQMEAFSELYQVIRYDVRNLGQSHTEPVEYSNADDLRALLRELEVASAHLVGLSMGGSIAIDFALEHPQMVESLVVAASGLSGYEPSAPMPPELQEIEISWNQGDMDRVLDLELRLWVDGPGQPPDRADPRVREKVIAMERENMRTEVDGASARKVNPPAAGRLGEIQAPTLVLVGSLDVPGIIQTSDFLASHVAGARKVTFDGTAHMLSMEQPDTFNRTVLEFLAGADQQHQG